MNTWFGGCLMSSTKQSFPRAMPEPALLGMGQVLEGWPVPSPRFSASSGPFALPCNPERSCSLNPRSTAQATRMINDKEQG